jgi:hypothetical protein
MTRDATGHRDKPEQLSLFVNPAYLAVSIFGRSSSAYDFFESRFTIVSIPSRTLNFLTKLYPLDFDIIFSNRK